VPSLKAQALAAHLDAAAPSVTSPWHYLALVFTYLATAAADARAAAGELIDTPEEREAIEQTVLSHYDKITVALMSKNVAMATLFHSLRSTVKGALDFILLALAPPPPAPVTPPTP
jgi:hypothetical protein